MAYPQRSNWGTFINPQFNRIQSEIERQTEALLRQRNLMNEPTYINQSNQYQQSLKEVESQRYLKLNTDRSDNVNQYGKTKSVLSDKVRQLIDLCKSQNSAFGTQLAKVLNQQKNIYGDLMSSNKLSSQKTHYFGGTNPIIEAQKQSSIAQGSREQPLSGMSSGNQSPTKVNNAQKSTIRQAIQRNSKIQVGDDLIQMIEQIQRKALNEIQKLREQKIDLMKQLKQQIQSNNQLQKQMNALSQQKSQNKINQGVQNYTPYKQYQPISNVNTAQKNTIQEQVMLKIRAQMQNLRRENDNLRFNLTRTSAQNLPNTQVINLQNRNNYLQNQLRNRDLLINSLTMEISRLNQCLGSSDNLNVRQLYEQGQSIRQNTLHLIKLKQGFKNTSNQSGRIRQLEQLLQRQEQQKESFLNDLLAFKQKYQNLQEQNRQLKRQSTKIGSSDLTKFSPIVQKSFSGNNIGASLDDYQKLLYQMRGNRY